MMDLFAHDDNRRATTTQPADLDALYAAVFSRAPEPAADRLFRAALDRGVVTLAHLRRVFVYLHRCRALPAVAGPTFARHFTMWLEIINHGRFIPIITARGRLDALASLLASRLGDAGRPLQVADVGTGQPPFTTVELAARLVGARVHGFDLYLADALVQRPDGAYAVFDGAGALRAVHCSDPARLHALLLDWSHHAAEFTAAYSRLRDGAGPGEVARGRDGWELMAQPAQALLRAAGRPDVQLHAVAPGDFLLAAVPEDSLDAVWSFNCLLHYSPAPRRAAMATMARRLRPGGLIMEGYTSPSGAHAIYQVWRREGSQLAPIEFGWTTSNLRYPLWPLHDDDPQTELLARILGHLGRDRALVDCVEAAAARSAPLAPEGLARIAGRLHHRELPARIAGRFVIHDTSRRPELFRLESIDVSQ